MNYSRKLIRNLSALLAYLVTDPTHVLHRVRQLSRNFLAQTQKVRPLSASNPGKVTPVAVLILDGRGGNIDGFVDRFRAIFGNTALVCRKTEKHGYTLYSADEAEHICLDLARLEGAVFFWPEDPGHATMVADYVLSAYLAIVINGIDLAVISHHLGTGREVALDKPRNHMFFSRHVAGHVLRNDIDRVAFTGKILRLLPECCAATKASLERLLGSPVVLDGEGFFKNKKMGAMTKTCYSEPDLAQTRKTRPLVFVFPIFLAVGGVERNTIEIMRQLRGNFDFVIVTMERLDPHQGSLAHQAHDVAVAVLEMSEIVRHSEYLEVLSLLKKKFLPDLIWVCNGSPWFCDNALNIRGLFGDLPIVDQEVYDEKRGWISRYNDKGIRSFDHFIAVNKKIQRRFINDFRIEPERTSLIYSSIDTSRIAEYKQSLADRATERDKYGLPRDKKIFTFVARLTKQKRPLLFLEIATSRLHMEDECYVLVGDGEMAKQAEKFIARHELKNVVRIPYVENTLELHAVSQGIIFTSEYEGLPVAMLEALAMGVPAFSTDVGDIADVLTEFGGGSVLHPGSTRQQFIDGFCEWCEHQGEYAENLRNNEQQILERFSSKNISRQYENCWRDLISEYEMKATC